MKKQNKSKTTHDMVSVPAKNSPGCHEATPCSLFVSTSTPKTTKYFSLVQLFSLITSNCSPKPNNFVWTLGFSGVLWRFYKALPPGLPKNLNITFGPSWRRLSAILAWVRAILGVLPPSEPLQSPLKAAKKHWNLHDFQWFSLFGQFRIFSGLGYISTHSESMLGPYWAV